VVAATILILAAPAAAVPNVVCPEGKVFDEGRGACRAVVRKCAKVSEALGHVEAFEKDGDTKRADQGVKLLDKLCKKSCREACSQLGLVYRDARANVTQDVQKSLDFYVEACRLKDDDGCIQAFEIHHNGQLGAGTMDSSKGLPYLEKACTKLASGRACHRLAQIYEWGGTNVLVDTARSTKLYDQAFPLLEHDCEDGDGQACATVGQIYQDKKSDLKTAMARFKRGCDNHGAYACYYLAYLQDPEAYLYAVGRDKIMDPACIATASYNAQCGNYYDDDQDGKSDYPNDPGCSSATDNDEADTVPPPSPLAATCWAPSYKLYEKACTEYDHFDSCIKAGSWLADEKVVGDTSKVELMAKRVCKLSAYSCNLWAKLKDAGRLVAYDATGALDLYVKACDAGNGEACMTASERYLYSYSDTAKGLTLLEKACELYQSSACTRAAYEYQYGYYGAQDLPKAFSLYQTACNRGDVDGCLSTGNMLLEGKYDGSLVPNAQEAAGYFENACTYYGNVSACSTLGRLYEDGTIGGTPNLDLAVQYYESSCLAWESWDTSACAKVIKFRSAGARKDLVAAARAQIVICKNYGSLDDCRLADKMLSDAGADVYTRSELRDRLEAACTGTYPIESACTALAVFLRDGSYAIAKDLAQANQILERSCERYSAEACFHLGASYEKSKDLDAARLYYTRACDNWFRDGCVAAARVLGDPREALEIFVRLCHAEQHPSACTSAATSYYAARGVTWDVGEAYRLFDRACELEDAAACDTMGTMWEHGVGQAPDVDRAYESYQRACSGGYVPACGRAGRFLELGTGVTADAARAETYYVQACETGDAPDACRWLADLYQQTAKAKAPRIAQLYQRAFDLAKTQSANGAYQLWLLGTFHRDGVATMKSATEAAKLFVQACEAYLPLGCLEAGRMYLGKPGSEGLTADYALAKVQLDKACAANVVEACALAEQALLGPSAGAVQKHGCCQTGGGPAGSGAITVLVLLALTAGRKRRAR